MNAYDEELQKNIEKGGRHQNDDLNARAYQEIFRVLRKDPGYELPPQFASKVIARFEERKRRDESRDYAWFLSGLTLILLASIATIIYLGYQPDFGFLAGMSEYKGLVGFAIAFIVFLNWLDKRLVKEKLMQHRS
jgi:hypothetical protein